MASSSISLNSSSILHNKPQSPLKTPFSTRSYTFPNLPLPKLSFKCIGTTKITAATAEFEVARDVTKEEEEEGGRVLRVGIICGGPSAERGISLNSARSVLDHIQVFLIHFGTVVTILTVVTNW